jgi:hypothetical protein
MKAGQQSDRVLTLSDLKAVSGPRDTDVPVDEALVDAMAGWCNSIDEFGSLLWMGGALM